ncbi:unnamed protein product [Closterium sp. Naga37s-1]|nr:unnamed protein product [Closterium sp. Naga37s-1]
MVLRDEARRGGEGLAGKGRGSEEAKEEGEREKGQEKGREKGVGREEEAQEGEGEAVAEAWAEGEAAAGAGGRHKQQARAQHHRRNQQQENPQRLRFSPSLPAPREQGNEWYSAGNIAAAITCYTELHCSSSPRYSEGDSGTVLSRYSTIPLLCSLSLPVPREDEKNEQYSRAEIAAAAVTCYTEVIRLCPSDPLPHTGPTVPCATGSECVCVEPFVCVHLSPPSGPTGLCATESKGENEGWLAGWGKGGGGVGADGVGCMLRRPITLCHLLDQPRSVPQKARVRTRAGWLGGEKVGEEWGPTEWDAC